MSSIIRQGIQFFLSGVLIGGILSQRFGQAHLLWANDGIDLNIDLGVACQHSLKYELVPWACYKLREKTTKNPTKLVQIDTSVDKLCETAVNKRPLESPPSWLKHIPRACRDIWVKRQAILKYKTGDF